MPFFLVSLLYFGHGGAWEGTGELHRQDTSWAVDTLGFILLVVLGWGGLRGHGLPHTHTVGTSHTPSDFGQTHTVQIFGPVGFWGRKETVEEYLLQPSIHL